MEMVKMARFLKVATLSAADVAKIRDLEEITDTHVMAFEPGFRIASLSQADLQKVRELEEQLGVTLLAFEAE
jgi:hypothetical protein